MHSGDRAVGPAPTYTRTYSTNTYSMNYKGYTAEFIGTFLLALVVGLSIKASFVVATPVLAAMVLLFCVYSFGSISGAHINPAVTIALYSVGKVSSRDVMWHLLAQCAAGAAALIALDLIQPGAWTSVFRSGNLMTAVAEIVGTGVFTFGIMTALAGKVGDHLSGFYIGLSLLLGIAVASLMGSAGILNPAVAIGLGVFDPMYLFAPILGGYLGVHVYKMTHGR
jgi:glycerol uptake facilitator-like aquaporin